MDLSLNEALDTLRTPEAVQFFAWITLFADTMTVTVLCLLATVAFWVFGRAHLILPLWVSYARVLATIQGIKLLVGRARPEPLEGIIATSSSFPSGNAGIAAAVYGILAYLIARETTSAGRRRVLVSAAILIMVLVGFSRLLLRVHYLFDVLAGFVIGGLWVLAGIFLTRYRQAGRDEAEISTA